MQIKLDDIADPPVYLRPVDTSSVEFRELVGTMRDFGQHNSILVRPHAGDRPYQLVDGAYRCAAARSLGWVTIEATCREIADGELLLCQIQANAVKKETSRVDYAKHLLRIQQAFPEITMVELARYSGKNTYWVRQQLDLLNLRLEFQTMADRGILPVMNAYSLAKLPPHIQGRYIDQAKIMPPSEFKTLVAAEVQRLMMNAKDRSEERRIAALSEQPHPFLRPFKHITDELRTREAAKGIIAAIKPTNVIDAFALGVAWTLNMDPVSIEERKQRNAERSVSRVIQRNLEDDDR